MTLEHLEDRLVPTGTAQIALNIGAANPIITASPSQMVPVFIDISNISTGGGAGGIGSGSYYVKYDPTVLSINETTVAPGTTGSDIQLGSLLSSLSAAYGLSTAAGYTPGIVAIGLSHGTSTFLTGTPSGHLIELDFHVIPGAVPAGGETTLLDLVPQSGVGKTTNQTDSSISNKYTLTPALGTYCRALTQPGILTPSTLPTADSDTADAAIQINYANNSAVVTGTADTYNIAPNNGNFAPGTMNVAASGGVLGNDTTTSSGGKGTMTAQAADAGAAALPIATVGITSATETGNTVTVTTSAAHTYAPGEEIAISGVSQAGYNGKFVIGSVLSSTQFTYTATAAGLSNGTGGIVYNTTAYTETTANGGVVTLNGDGSFTYAAASGFTGQDTFNYKAMDAQSGTASTSTAVTVNVGAMLTMPHQNEAAGSTFTIPINIASANPANSGGLTQAVIAINYDAEQVESDRCGGRRADSGGLERFQQQHHQSGSDFDFDIEYRVVRELGADHLDGAWLAGGADVPGVGRREPVTVSSTSPMRLRHQPRNWWQARWRCRSRLRRWTTPTSRKTSRGRLTAWSHCQAARLPPEPRRRSRQTWRQ